MNNEELFRLIERGPDDVGAALKLLEQAIAEERTEAKRLMRDLMAVSHGAWERKEVFARAEEFLRRG